MNNVAGEVWIVFVHLISATRHFRDVYTVVLPDNLTSRKEQLRLLHRTWPKGGDGEILILQALLGEPG